MVVITRCVCMETPTWADLWLCHCGKARVVINCVSELTFARPFSLCVVHVHALKGRRSEKRSSFDRRLQGLSEVGRRCGYIFILLHNHNGDVNLTN